MKLPIIIFISLIFAEVSCGLFDQHDSNGEEWLEIVQRYLEDHLESYDPDGYFRLLFYLHNEVKLSDFPAVLKHLHDLVRSGKPHGSVKPYLDEVVKDTKRAESDGGYRLIMGKVHELLLSAGDLEPGSPEWNTQIEKKSKSIVDPVTDQIAALSYITQAMSRVPRDAWPAVLALFDARVEVALLQPAVKASQAIIESDGAALARIKLVGAQLSWQAVKNIYRWWNGEISGTRCAKNVVDEYVSTAGGLGFSYVGGTLGTIFAGPLGTVLGSVAGGFFGYKATEALVEQLTAQFFDLPKDEALETAFGFLGVHHESENSVINERYKELARKYHPDVKDGKEDKFIQLQVSMEIIRNSRSQD